MKNLQTFVRIGERKPKKTLLNLWALKNTMQKSWNEIDRKNLLAW